VRDTLKLKGAGAAREIAGPSDRNLRQIRDAFGVQVVLRQNTIHLESRSRAALAKSRRAFDTLCEILKENGELDEYDVNKVIYSLENRTEALSKKTTIAINGRVIRPRTVGQQRFLASIETHDIVMCIGPAGTGKTYLAVAAALYKLIRGEIRRIVLVRPAVEAGEKLGFLPGDFRQKVNPYLQPIYDALRDMTNTGQLERYVEKGVVEIAPLAYMRGRTLNNAFVILDEAQNTTPAQMMMFLTRLGEHSRAIVTGDITQIDLPARAESGLVNSERLLKHIEGVDFVYLSRDDIVRHRLVKEIVDAYESQGAKKKKKKKG